MAAASLALAGPAAAEGGSRPGAGSVLDLALLERSAALRIRAEARARLIDALDPTRDTALGPAPDVLLEQAIARYDVVLESFPGDVDAWLERGRALAAFHRFMADGHEEMRVDEAIASYERARALDPEREAAALAFELAVLRTRRGDYAGASLEYARADAARELLPLGLPYMVSRRERALAQLFSPAPIERVLANWAEVTMLSGDAAAAITRYRAAFDAAARGSDSAALALWGLALAEERTGSHGDAIETALRAIDADAGSPHRATIAARYGAFAVLHDEGVFFEPACEIHAYESLGHEALATRASTAEGRHAEWTAARHSARYFLAEGGRSSPYASTAIAADARLGALLSP